MKSAYIDDSDITEIIIQPDGRIYAFGLSVEVAKVLEELKHQTTARLVATEDHGMQSADVGNSVGGMNGQG